MVHGCMTIWLTFEVVDSAEVIDEASGMKVVHGRESSEADRVVVVSVDAEDRKADVHVGVVVVDHPVSGVAVREVDFGIAQVLFKRSQE